MHFEFQTAAFDRGAKAACDVACQPREVGWLEIRLNATGFEAGEIEQSVDHFLEAEAVAMDDPEKSLRLFGCSCAFSGEELFDRAKHQRDRGSKLVADVAEKNGLGSIKLGESVGAALFVFCSTSVVNCTDELVDDEREEGEIFRVEVARRIDTTDQESERGDLGGRGDRKNDSFANGLLGSAVR